jgi:hypothetical protein
MARGLLSSGLVRRKTWVRVSKGTMLRGQDSCPLIPTHQIPVTMPFVELGPGYGTRLVGSAYKSPALPS